MVEARLRQQAELERVHEVGPMLPPMPSREARAKADKAWGGDEPSPGFDMRSFEPPGVIERIGMRAAKAIARSGKEALTATQIHAALEGLKDEYRRPLTKERVRRHLDELAGKTRHVREVAGRYASLRPSEASVDPVPRRQERSRADAVVEELLAPLEEGWSSEHLVADEISSRKFWDGVLRHAVFVIRASGKEALSAEEILAGLPPP